MVATRAGVELESFDYHRASDTYRSRYDRETTPTSLAIVASLSEAMAVDPSELEPIQGFIDTDALDDLVSVRGSTSGELLVTVRFGEHRIRVSSRGLIEITPPETSRTDRIDRIEVFNGSAIDT